MTFHVNHLQQMNHTKFAWNIFENVVYCKFAGYESCVLLGHDWGGAIAWNVATLYPGIVEKLIVFNCPHPAVFQRYIREHTSQFKKSWWVNSFISLSPCKCCLLITFANSLDPDQAPTECRAWSRSNLLGTLIVFLKELFENVDFEKSADNKKAGKFFQGGQRVIRRISIFRCSVMYDWVVLHVQIRCGLFNYSYIVDTGKWIYWLKRIASASEHCWLSFISCGSWVFDWLQISSDSIKGLKL